MPEKKAPKPSISDDFKGLAKGTIWTASYGLEDKTKWTDKDWMIFHMDYLQRTKENLACQRTIMAFLLIALAIIAAIK